MGSQTSTAGPGFDLTTHDLYLMILAEVLTNQILAENTYLTNHIEYRIQNYGPETKYQVFWQCHNFKNSLIND